MPLVRRRSVDTDEDIWDVRKARQDREAAIAAKEQAQRTPVDPDPSTAEEEPKEEMEPVGPGVLQAEEPKEEMEPVGPERTEGPREELEPEDPGILQAKNSSVVEAFFRCLNAHDLKGAKLLQTENVKWLFRDINGNLVHQMNWDEFERELTKCFAAFPDFTFTYGTVRANVDSAIVLHVVTTGTHTGSPFALGPCPAIPTSHRFFQNDPEDIQFTIVDGKMAKHEIFARGEQTGPAGIYQQLGGFPLLGELPPGLPG